MNATFYTVDFAVDDRDPVQQTLNRLYAYERDTTTKVLHRARLNLFVRIAEELGQRGLPARRERALDVGCSAGAYARILADLGFRSVVGIDPDAGAVEAAEATFGGPGIEFRVARAEDLDARGEFDLVLCTEVLEHTADPERVVAIIAGALAPGGVAVVSLPNAFSLPYATMRLGHALRRRRLGQELRDHLGYPFWRVLRLLDRPGLSRVLTRGSNLVLDPKLIGFVYGRRFFPTMNRVNFALARSWPFRYVSQFFFVAVTRVE
jgi:SAM-dependent methyltransferase